MALKGERWQSGKSVKQGEGKGESEIEIKGRGVYVIPSSIVISLIMQ